MTLGYDYWTDQEEARQRRISEGPRLQTSSPGSAWGTVIVVILVVWAFIAVVRHIQDASHRLTTPESAASTKADHAQQQLEASRPYWRRGLAGLAGARSSQTIRGLAVFLLWLVANFWFTVHAGRFFVPLAGMLVSYVVFWGVPEGVWPSLLMCAVVVPVALIARFSEEQRQARILL